MKRVVVNPYVIQGGLDAVRNLADSASSLLRLDYGVSGGSCFLHLKDDAEANVISELAKTSLRADIADQLKGSDAKFIARCVEANGQVFDR